MFPNLTTLVGIAHGTSSPIGTNLISALIEAVVASHPEVDVALGYVDVQQPDTKMTLDLLTDGRAAVVVPLLLSSGYHVHVDLKNEVDSRTDRKVLLAKALGPDHRLIELLKRRLAQIGFTESDRVVLAVAGSSDERAVSGCEIVRSALSEATGQNVTIGYLSAMKPSLPDAIKAARAYHPTQRIVVSSYLLAPGHFQTLIERASADLFTPPLLAPNEPIPEEVVEIVFDRYEEMLKHF